jgi:glycine dehydrogenase
MTATFQPDDLDPNAFAARHIGPNQADIDDILAALGLSSLNELTARVVPKSILKPEPLTLPAALSEQQALVELKTLAEKNLTYKSLLGLGYYDTITPTVIQRNVLENPGWYTAYTPYQPEIAQGRLEGLLTFQQMIMDLTGLDMANASMLDEATAAAEAMAMAKRQLRKNKSITFFVDVNCHPQTIAVVKTRAEHFNLNIITGDPDVGFAEDSLSAGDYFGALLQNPGSNGEAKDLSSIIKKIHHHGALAIVAADPMSMVLVNSPGSMGADIVVGSNQRFGVAPGFGGPHAGFLAFSSAHKRSAPGRIIGVSVDQRGKPALRMAMQTREQHIRREKANSNICTAQVLLALMSAFYAMYHGPQGLKKIALKIHQLCNQMASGFLSRGYQLRYRTWFDTLTIETPNRQQEIITHAEQLGINLRPVDDDAIAISLDEACDSELVKTLLTIFESAADKASAGDTGESLNGLPEKLLRKDNILLHPIFNSYHSETEMLRYLKRMESRDISLTDSMIPLGSCTMKLNSTAEMMPVTWPEFSQIHPFAPAEQANGYHQLLDDLENMLIKCTGYAAVSLQPNAGSQGEYAGLVAIKKYHQSRGEKQRDICLIPSSAHGTNPATAHMVGMKVVVVKCDDDGNIDIDDLQEQVLNSGNRLAALMVTYPSTHGVFETDIVAICQLVHDNGGQVYIDGANLNAMVGIADPGKFGGDVSHINLHKTFCIPHGGGGPGMGPIAVAEHLKPFLPGHPLAPQISATGRENTISAAPWGSPSILPISWMYIKMMGGEGLTRASQVAILNANYLAEKLNSHYPVLYTGQNGAVAHECIIDIRPLKASTGITEEDIAKRLMDYGYHAPTMSFPVPGTLMIEPTESESKVELDRFIKVMIMIRNEISRVESGEWDEQNNPLKQAPHTITDILEEQWDRPYSRELAARPTPWQQEHKVWPTVNRIDNVYGDRNLVCSCPPVSDYEISSHESSN